MRIRQGSHGVQRQAWRHPDGHLCALRRLDNGQLLLDTQGDRPQDAVDAHLARMEPWQGDAPPESLRRIATHITFEVWSMHSDNEGEPINLQIAVGI